MGKILKEIEERDPKRSVGFSASPVLPGEDQKEFQCLLDELSAQYEPVGPVEQDVIRTIASAIFRKRHLEIFQLAFVARRKWEPYFQYPGDPYGPARIAEAARQLANAEYVKLIEKHVTVKVKNELAKDTVDGTETKECIEGETDRAHEAINLFATDPTKTPEETSEDNFKGVVEKAVAEINEKKSRRRSGAMNSDEIADIVGSNTKIAFDASIKLVQSNGPRSRRENEARKAEAVDELFDVFEAIFGPGTIKEMLEPLLGEDIKQSLAQLGDLLTPERYAAELQFNELLDLAIERSHDRLMKYQAARAKKLPGNISSLQPGWTRKR